MDEEGLEGRNNLNYPLLRKLEGYLHQDWPEDYNDDVWLAIDDYISGRSESDLRGIVEELTSLLRLTYRDSELEKLLSGIDYYPPGDGYTWRGWLEELRRYVVSAAKSELDS